MVLVVRRDEVEECLRREPGYEGALAVLETSFRELGLHNRVVSYRDERTRLRYPPDVDEAQVEKDLWIMPMYIPAIGCGAMRIGSGDDSIIAVYDFQYMGLQAILQDRPLDGVRIGLPLALAAKYLGPPKAPQIGCIGAGAAAEAAVTAMAAGQRPARVAIRGRDGVRGEDLARHLSVNLGVPAQPVASAEDATRGAGIVIIAPEEMGRGRVRDAWVAPSTLIATSDPDAVEPATRVRATVIHASRRHAPAWAAQEGPIVELGDVIRGEHPGRAREDEIFVFVSPPGIGFYDVVTAWWCYGVAKQQGLGVEVPLVSSEPLDEAAGL